MCRWLGIKFETCLVHTCQALEFRAALFGVGNWAINTLSKVWKRVTETLRSGCHFAVGLLMLCIFSTGLPYHPISKLFGASSERPLAEGCSYARMYASAAIYKSA